MFNGVGKTTPMLARFSTVAGELGSPDTARDPRGFALKFYTQEGNYDLVGNNTPVFFVRDPSNFQDFIHSQKRRADTDRRDNNMQWDFWTLKPESAHQVTILMSDRGTPKTMRHMNGYGSHTFMWVNAGGERFWIKYHFKTDQGIENFTDAEAGDDGRARTPTSTAPTCGTRSATATRRRGRWRSRSCRSRTRRTTASTRSTSRRSGRTATTRRSRSAGWCSTATRRTTSPRSSRRRSSRPTWCPGIGPSPDKMLLGRLFSYPDTHRYRIGPNYLQLPVNRPQCPVHSYNKDGAMRYENPGDPVYAPNTAGGPAADEARYGEDATWHTDGDMVRTAYTLRADDDDFGQPGTLVREVMSQDRPRPPRRRTSSATPATPTSPTR